MMPHSIFLGGLFLLVAACLGVLVWLGWLIGVSAVVVLVVVVAIAVLCLTVGMIATTFWWRGSLPKALDWMCGFFEFFGAIVAMVAWMFLCLLALPPLSLTPLLEHLTRLGSAFGGVLVLIGYVFVLEAVLRPFQEIPAAPPKKNGGTS